LSGRAWLDVPTPPRLTPLVSLYGEAVAAPLAAALRLLESVTRFRFENAELEHSRVPHISCLWHRDFLSFFAATSNDGVPRVTFAHPAWYIEPWRVIGRRFGWTMVEGSTGHGGREAADRIVEYLRRGHSTFVLPDGPLGPPFVLKRGALHMARAAGVPILPLRFECNAWIELGWWDGRRVPRPGAEVRVRCGPLLEVGGDLDEAARRLTEALG
jgi:lysophospholipid acyltransferase (LPLAT)-like uncharacterized protein